ncbi:MAG: uroporphyrinogen-III synthase [Gammaproteobacteria bacterium]|nr:uroporphyrinogen-III synthase [Gammaproteobacteria bacterium]
MTSALAGLRLLVTRPAQQAGKWQRLLEAEGATTVAIALLEIVPFEQPGSAAVEAIKARILQLDVYQHGIFVSQNAAQYGSEWIDQYWPQLPLGLQFYAVGSATAALLQNRGLNVVAAGGSMNSEELLRLPALQALQQQRVLIFRGAGGRPLLADSLAQRGARVDYCELYQRRLPAAAGAALRRLDWGAGDDITTVHSGETLHNLWQLLSAAGNETGQDPGRWLQLPLLVPGERVAKQARELGFRNVIMAVNASDASMLQALLDWQNTR